MNTPDENVQPVEDEPTPVDAPQTAEPTENAPSPEDVTTFDEDDDPESLAGDEAPASDDDPDALDGDEAPASDDEDVDTVE